MKQATRSKRLARNDLEGGLSMKLNAIWKMVQFNLLTQAGIPVTPEQLGIKPNAANGTNSPFSQILNGQNGGVGSMPTPPTPPADMTDAAAVAKYNQDLLTYNQQFQQYQLRMMQMMNQRFMQMQQAIQQAARNNASTSNRSGSSALNSNERIGVGGILDSVSDINNV
jgi:hypothetical protein